MVKKLPLAKLSNVGRTGMTKIILLFNFVAGGNFRHLPKPAIILN